MAGNALGTIPKLQDSASWRPRHVVQKRMVLNAIGVNQLKTEQTNGLVVSQDLATAHFYTFLGLCFAIESATRFPSLLFSLNTTWTLEKVRGRELQRMASGNEPKWKTCKRRQQSFVCDLSEWHAPKRWMPQTTCFPNARPKGIDMDVGHGVLWHRPRRCLCEDKKIGTVDLNQVPSGDVLFVLRLGLCYFHCTYIYYFII